MKLVKSLRNVLLAAMLLSAGVANAALYQFQITGDYTATWQLDSEQAPDEAQNGGGFTFIDVDGFDDAFFGVADVSFFNTAIGGGVQIYDWYADNYLLSTDGPQLYTGSENRHEFLLGTFALTEYEGFGNYVLTITDLDAIPDPVDVPEPATAAMLLGGLGLLAASRKRRQRK